VAGVGVEVEVEVSVAQHQDLVWPSNWVWGTRRGGGVCGGWLWCLVGWSPLPRWTLPTPP